MVMANGMKFSTGNHPVEMALPMLHLMNAGFELDIVTPTGAPAIIEEWAIPKNDKSVAELFAKYDDAFAKPNSLIDFAKNSLIDDTPYLGVFIQGGNGSMLGLPNDPNLGKLLRWAQKKDIHIITLCHGPVTLMSAKIDG